MPLLAAAGNQSRRAARSSTSGSGSRAEGIGVPLTNYLGWFFTVYLFLQLFALFVRFRPGKETARTFPRSHYAQAVLTYAVMGLTPVLTFVIGGSNSLVTDAAGVVWQTRSIAESVAIVSIYTLLFAVV